MAKFYKSLPFVLAVLCASCADKGLGDGQDQGSTVRVTGDLVSKGSVDFSTGEDLDFDQVYFPKAEDFKVAILKGVDTLKQFDSYSSIVEGVDLGIGEYKLSATYGDRSRAGWNTTYFDGAVDFVLSNSDRDVKLDLECNLKSSFAFAKFDDKFRAVFKDFSAEFYTEYTKVPLVFVDGEKRIASFRECSKLWVVVKATKIENNKKVTYGIDPVFGVKGGDLNVFNFTVSDGVVSFDLTVDNGVNVIEKSIDLNPNWLDNRGSKMQVTFDQQAVFANVYGLPHEKPADVVVTSNVGLASLSIKFDEAFAAEMGCDSVDMLSASADVIAMVKNRVGVVVTKNVDGMAYRVDMKRCVNALKVRNAAETNYAIGIGCVDNAGSYFESKYNVKVVPPKFKRGEQDPLKVWTRFAYIPHAEVTNVSEADKKRFPLEYWISEDGVNWKSLGIIERTSDVYLNELKYNTKYYTKVTFEDYVVGLSSFTTGNEAQIPNGDFEDFTMFTYGGTDFPIHTYEFNSGWATLNEKTTQNRTGTSWAKSYPCVRVVNGVNGGKAAEISTIGYGNDALLEHLPYKLFVNDEEIRTTKWGTYEVGKVFLGSYNGSESHGVMFDSKPKMITFKYKFKCKNSNGPWNVEMKLFSGNDVIGRTKFTPSNENKDVFTEVQLPIVYDANFKSIEVTSIQLCFVAQTGDVAANSGNLDVIWGQDRRGYYTGIVGTTKNWVESIDSRHCGNVLTVDEIKLIYPTSPEDKYTIE